MAKTHFTGPVEVLDDYTPVKPGDLINLAYFEANAVSPEGAAAAGAAAGAVAGAEAAASAIEPFLQQAVDAGAAAGTAAGTSAGTTAANNLSKELVLPDQVVRIVRGINDFWTPKDFGPSNIGDPSRVGADDAPVLRKMMNAGVKLYFPKGLYTCRSLDPGSLSGASYIMIKSPTVDITLDAQARIWAGPEVGNISGALIRAYPRATSGSYFDDYTGNFSFRGGILDTSQIVNTLDFGLASMDIFGYYRCSLENILYYGGVTDPQGGPFGVGDTGVTTHNVNDVLISGCKFVGFRDAGIYLSGTTGSSPNSGIGERAVVVNNFSVRSAKLVTAKRDFRSVVVSNNQIREAASGIIAGAVGAPGTNHGKNYLISNNHLWRLSARPIAVYGGISATITGNMVHDYGMDLATQAYTVTSAGNWIAGIGVYGTEDAVVTGNYVAQQKEWTASDTISANLAPRGIVLANMRTDTPESEKWATGALINNNNVRNVYRGIEETTGCDYNIIKDNVTRGTTVANVIVGANSWMESAEDNMLKESMNLAAIMTSPGGDAVNYSVQRFQYWRRGKQVNFQCIFTLTNNTGLSGNVSIPLPFTVQSGGVAYPCSVTVNANVVHQNASYLQFMAEAAQNTKTLNLLEVGSGIRRNMTEINFNPGATISVSGAYLTSDP